MKKINLILVAAIMLFSVGISYSQITGDQIIKKVYDQPAGDDTQGELTMTLTNKSGEQRVRKIKQYMKSDSNTDKKIMFFMSPADVKGTSFMSWSYNDGRDDDQWIYLPALKKTKRISSDGKSDYFMGSDFTYDDLGDRHPSEDTHKLLREETINGKACYVIESKPKDEDYMYSKTVTWVIKDIFIGLKREFYDENGKLLKTLEIKSFEKISGFWVITDTEMKNVQKNHKTNMKFENIQINKGLADSKFSERSMTMGY
jgi:outer membrane lipoprotein-sorting protein